MLREAHKTRREYIYIIMISTRTGEHMACNLVEHMIQYISVQHISTRIMYDDYDLDYTYTNDYNLDEDAYYEHYIQLDASDLDEDYARDSQDYNDLAYRHYA